MFSSSVLRSYCRHKYVQYKSCRFTNQHSTTQRNATQRNTALKTTTYNPNILKIEGVVISTSYRSVISYTCNEPYFTRMIVDYLDDNGRRTQEIVEGSGSTVELPEHATEIEVKFQNQRFIGTWCDVKKYNRITKCWKKPTVPHVFTFPEPVTRAFTLAGSLHYVAVMKIRDEFYQLLDIME